MFRIRRVHAVRTPADRQAVATSQAILKQQFQLLSAEEIDKLPSMLADPVAHGFKTVLLAADDARGRVLGFALVLHFADQGFSFLDYMSVTPGRTGGGIGAALYERVREEVRAEGMPWLLYECLPDDPELCPDPATLKQNEARLKFYERYGARPIVNTAYETPVNPGDTCPPYLVLDALRHGQDPERELTAMAARRMVRAMLGRKYHDICGPEYIDMVASSFSETPVALREPRYLCHVPHIAPQTAPVQRYADLERTIWLTVNDRHDIHHVHDRGYVESPVRVDSILKGIEPTGLFQRIKPQRFPEEHIKAVHDKRFVDYLKAVCANVPPGRSIYPYVFPIRNQARPPKDLPVRAGYYCIDTFTPLNENAYKAARRAVDCGLTAAKAILDGARLAYALVRPPGHHAERKSFGGFCYFNTSAVCAHYLSQHGRVAVLDVDYHHGNGTQDIFYERGDVLTLSIHGHPSFAYPYFSGYAEETGEGDGLGCNLNLPQPEHLDGEGFRKALNKALKRIREFGPDLLVLALGLDTAKSDPTGTWSLTPKDFGLNGELIGGLGLPTLVIQEGGYRVRTLNRNARSFFEGLMRGAFPANEDKGKDKKKPRTSKNARDKK